MSNPELVRIVSLNPGPEEVSSGHAYVDWPAIFAGAVVAVAISTVIGSFGIAVGLSTSSPLSGHGISGAAILIATGLWVMWIAISSFAAGGYLTGRLRRRIHDASEHESDVRDGIHGLVVWAIGAILLAYLTTISATGLVRQAAAPAAGALAFSSPAARIADRVLAPPITNAPTSPALSARNYRAGVTGIVNDALVSASPISGADKELLTAQIVDQTGIAAAEASKRVDVAQQQITQVRQNAKMVADRARKIGILLAFLSAAALSISAAAAWWAATIGGQHRDNGVDLSHLTAWR